MDVTTTLVHRSLVAGLLLLLAHPVTSQDRSGVLGGGLGYYGMEGGGSGTALQLELSSNINRVHALIQYRLTLSYVGLSVDERESECGTPETGSCPLEPTRYDHLGMAWAPVLQIGAGETLRLRLSPLGAGVFIRHRAVELPGREPCGGFGDPCADGDSTFVYRNASAAVGYGLRSALDFGVHWKPFVLQAGLRWQQGLGSQPGHFFAPVSLGWGF